MEISNLKTSMPQEAHNVHNPGTIQKTGLIKLNAI